MYVAISLPIISSSEWGCSLIDRAESGETGLQRCRGECTTGDKETLSGREGMVVIGTGTGTGCD